MKWLLPVLLLLNDCGLDDCGPKSFKEIAYYCDHGSNGGLHPALAHAIETAILEVYPRIGLGKGSLAECIEDTTVIMLPGKYFETCYTTIDGGREVVKCGRAAGTYYSAAWPWQSVINVATDSDVLGGALPHEFLHRVHDCTDIGTDYGHTHWSWALVVDVISRYRR